ncbi:sugar transferase [Actinomadura sp. NPDC049753]|uniref:sugar transferase n=1 Tax=Actinomadura sp. NPDC049753 TaxID=3154739 RepID=UPI003449CE68
MLPDLPGARLTGPAWTLSAEKRALDLLIAGAISPVYVPTAAVGAALMFLENGRAPLMRQWRIGRNGVPFRLLHVRTMEDGRGVDASRGSDDPRATPRGRVLRKGTLDQFVEVVHVVRGQMSISNPRPLLEFDRGLMRDVLSPSEYSEWDWATTIGRPGMYSTFGNESIGLEPQSERFLFRRAECDVEDARCASLERDLKIIGDTAKIGWSFVSRDS